MLHAEQGEDAGAHIRRVNRKFGQRSRPELRFSLHSPEAATLRVKAGPLNIASFHQGFCRCPPGLIFH